MRPSPALLLAVLAAAAALPGSEGTTPPSTAVATEATTPILFSATGGLEAVDPDGTNRRELVRNGKQGDLSADRSRLVYVVPGSIPDGLGSSQVLGVADGDGSNQTLLGGREIHGANPSWSPDGGRVAYDTALPDPTRAGATVRWVTVVGADGAGETVIAAGSDPDWSPDGQRLVYTALGRLWVVEPRPGAVAVAITPLVDVPPPAAGLVLSTPTWSPDGTTIGFGGDCAGGKVHPDGSGFRCYYSTSRGTVFGGWAPNSGNFVSSSSGFHEPGGMSWTDPGTGERHYVLLAVPTGWANPGGPVECGAGYWLAGRDGGVFAFGSAPFHGSAAGMRLNRPVVGVAGTAPGDGYWLVAADGGVFSFGGAPFHGSTGGLRLRAPVVGIERTPSGGGYWLVAADGGVFSFGDAEFHGSTGGLPLRAPVVDMVASAGGHGYWLVAADGGVFSFGDAAFHGSAADLPLAGPVVAMSALPGGDGYRLAAADGGTFDFGAARHLGNLGMRGMASPVTGMAAVGEEFVLVTAAGEVVPFDTIAFEPLSAWPRPRFCGSARGLRLAAPVVAVAPV